MPLTENVRVYDSSSADYHKAFQVFLDHTDQKAKAREWLGRLAAELPLKRVFIDAGAGNGKVTAWFTDLFQRTIAAEPSPSLRQELMNVCPRAEVLGSTILESAIQTPGDFILASHVFYYIDGHVWLENLERLVSWLSREGALVVVLQNHQSDCMKMLRYFLNRSFDLKSLASDFEEKYSAEDYQVAMETVPSYITAKDAESAYLIAEFMLNLLPLKTPPASEDVRRYIQKHFAVEGGGYRFSCTQDFLKICREKGC